MIFFKKIWNKITGKTEATEEHSIFLGMQLARPFTWVTNKDEGLRPCLRVSGLSLEDAKAGLIGKSINWDTLDYSYLKELELGGGIVDISYENLKKVMK